MLFDVESQCDILRWYEVLMPQDPSQDRLQAAVAMRQKERIKEPRDDLTCAGAGRTN